MDSFRGADPLASRSSSVWKNKGAPIAPRRTSISRSESIHKQPSVTSRSRSRSRGPSVLEYEGAEDTRDGWGGSSTVEASMPYAGRRGSDTHTFLPWNNTDKQLEDIYTQWITQKEVGPAEAYASVWKHTRKTREDCPTTIACYNPDSRIWYTLSDDEWMLEVGRWCRGQMLTMVARLQLCIDAQPEPAKDDPVGKQTVKSWCAARKACSDLISHIGNRNGMKNIAAVARILLKDTEFFDCLDSNRTVISFANGVLNLGEPLRDRNDKDMLSFALPYAYDPAADQGPIRQLVSNLFEDPSVETALQVHCGYFATGLTREKMFHQWWCESGSGKTVLLQILANALQDYMIVGDLPISEIEGDSDFESTLGMLLKRRPRPRLIVMDETNAGIKLNEQFINQVASGQEEIRIACRTKFKEAQTAEVFHAKLIISTNHPVSIPAASTGLAFRVSGAPFKFVFKQDYSKSDALAHWRKSDNDLRDFLLSPMARPGIMAWLIQGAEAYCCTGLPKNPTWEAHASYMRMMGDHCLAWFATTYTLTGAIEHRVTYDELYCSYTTAARSSRTAKDAISATDFRVALKTISNFVLQTRWAEPQPMMNPAPGQQPEIRIVHGCCGIRKRVDGDPSWKDAIPKAREDLRVTRAQMLEDVDDL